MAPICSPDDELDAFDESLLVHARRVEQLRRVGLPRFLAEKFADLVDLRDLEQLIEHGYMTELPLEIVRFRLLDVIGQKVVAALDPRRAPTTIAHTERAAA